VARGPWLGERDRGLADDLVAFDDVIGYELADDAIRELEIANVNRQVGERETIPQPLKALEVLHVIVPDRHVVAIELPEARQRSQRIEVVVEYGDVHGTSRNRSCLNSGEQLTLR
jgi:hypothetical protein